MLFFIFGTGYLPGTLSVLTPTQTSDLMNHPQHTCCLTLACGIVLAVAGCNRTGNEAGSPPPPPPPVVSVAQPLQKKIVEWIDFTGRLEAVNYVEIRSRVSGYLQSVHFQEGEVVEKDALLFVVDPRPFQSALEMAQAELEESKAGLEQSRSQLAQAQADKDTALAQVDFTQMEYDRQQKLREQNAASQSELDQARNAFKQAQAGVKSSDAGISLAKAAIATSTATIETAKASVAQAELDLEYTKVKAPITGRVSRRYVTEGNLISGGSEQSTLLTTIVSTDPIYFVFDGSEQQVLRYRRLVQQGDRQSARDVRYPAYLQLADEQGFPHQGYIDFIDNRFDPNTATMLARAVFPNEEDILTPGMFGVARIANSNEHEAILLPDEAIGADQSESFVYVIDEENQARIQIVETGPMALGLRVIRHGIAPGDRVVIGGLQRVRPGSPVDPKETTISADESQAVQLDATPMEKS